MWYTTEHLISNKISSQISHYIITFYQMNGISKVFENFSYYVQVKSTGNKIHFTKQYEYNK